MPFSKQALKELRRLQQKKFREQEKAFLIEGVRLCEEALQAGAALLQVLICPEQMQNDRSQKLIQALTHAAIPVDVIDAAALAALAETQAPQGIVAVVRKHAPKLFEPGKNGDPLLLAIDGIADPGNLGTILRSAEWFGVKNVLLSRDTVELHNPKVVRSSMGSLFRLEVQENLDLAETARHAKAAGWRLIAAEAAHGEPSHRISASGRDLLFIGSEAHGLVTNLAHWIDLRITIPGNGAGESLNAALAAGILLYQLTAPQ